MLLRLAYVSWRNVVFFFFFGNQMYVCAIVFFFFFIIIILFRKGQKLVQKQIFLKENMAFFFFCHVIADVETKN